MGKAWSFQQLGGERKLLTLEGRAAPHGRPRKGPVVTDAIKLRRERILYPGMVGPPTTHIFGVTWEDWELKGRFMDKFLGRGEVRQRIDAWQAFVADAERCSITWGDIVFTTGYVDKFVAERESEEECAYTIVLCVDGKPLNAFASPTLRATTPPGLAALVAIQAEDILHQPTAPRAVGKLKPSFVDSLDDTVSSINSFSAAIVQVAGEIDDFATGTLDQLERLRAGVKQTRTAVLKMRATLETTENESAQLARSSSSDIIWIRTRTDLDVSSTRLLALLDEMDREAEIAQRGRILTIYVARGQDTWESISTKFYGGPTGAGIIRDANGVQYGELPIPGRDYQIPVAA